MKSNPTTILCTKLPSNPHLLYRSLLTPYISGIQNSGTIFRHTSHNTCSNKSLLTLELSSYLLEIPNDTYTTLSQYSYWLFNTRSRVLKADWFALEIDEKATLNIDIFLLNMHDTKRIICEEIQHVKHTLTEIDWQECLLHGKNPIYACDWVSPLPHQI